MKKIVQLLLLLVLVTGVSSFTPSRHHYKANLKKVFVDENIDVWAGPGIGAHEVIIYVERTGPEAGMGQLQFDVDLMIDYIPSQVQSFHVEVPYGYTSRATAYYCNWVVGTDATVVGSIYNVTYD